MWWFREWLMKRYCPRYLESMPEDAPGKYAAMVYRTSRVSRFTGSLAVSATEVEGRLAAYKQARWNALKADWLTPECYGVSWRIQEIQ